jgi:dienelactone hydrolase
MNYYLIHPDRDPPGVATWSEDVTRGALRMHLIWVQPPGAGPFPTVIVHPAGGEPAATMMGVARDLARHGYLAVAVDYARLVDGEFESSLFGWRDTSDPVAALEVVRARPQVDAARIGALGFSQGGIYSLLMAAYSPDVRAVVAYYPVTDFRTWFDTERPALGSRIAFSIIEWYFRRESRATSDAEFEDMLRLASPMSYVESLRAPILLIHGADDTTASAEESRRLERALGDRGCEVELIVVPEAGHVFNFKQPEEARQTWDATLAWLQKYLSPPEAPAAGEPSRPPGASGETAGCRSDPGARPRRPAGASSAHSGRAASRAESPRTATR